MRRLIFRPPLAVPEKLRLLPTSQSASRLLAAASTHLLRRFSSPRFASKKISNPAKADLLILASSRGYGAPPHFSTALGGARKIAAAPDFAVREPPARGCFDAPPSEVLIPTLCKQKNKQPRKSGLAYFGVLERIRTSDPSLRRRVLYPAELRRQVTFLFAC